MVLYMSIGISVLSCLSLLYCHCLRSIFSLGGFLILSFFSFISRNPLKKHFLINCVLILRYSLYRKSRLNFFFIYWICVWNSEGVNILQRWPVSFLASLWIHEFKLIWHVVVLDSYLYGYSMFGRLGTFLNRLLSHFDTISVVCDTCLSGIRRWSEGSCVFSIPAVNLFSPLRQGLHTLSVKGQVVVL